MPAPTAPPRLTDGDVTLRAHHEDDIERILEQCRDPLSVRWTVVPAPYTPDHAKQFVRHAMPGGWASGEEWGFAVEHQGRFAGTVSLRNRGQGRAEIAYGAHPDARGCGVMSRALRLLLTWGFEAVGLGTVIWLANEGNWASRRLAWAVGFSFDGTLRGWLPHRDALVDAWTGTLRRGEALRPRGRWLEVPRIAGEHVVLRSTRDADVERVHEACSDERSAYWLGRFPAPYTRAHAEQFVLLREAGMAAGTDVHWVVADPDDDRLLGAVSLMGIGEGGAQIGYWTHPDARGRGVMTEGVRLAVRHAFVDAEDGGLGLERVHLEAAVDNTASRHVAEAAGLELQTVLPRAIMVRDGLHDSARYGALRP